jgi:3-phenylpropionate/trans-cinnamate dioxygenase ferredoxin subunit
MTVVCAFDELTDGGARKFDVGGVAVSVIRIGDDVYAVADTCTHANVSLSEGEVWCDEREIECPKHGSAFSLLDGEPTTLPATQPVAVYDARVVDGDVVVTASSTGPGAGEDAT